MDGTPLSRYLGKTDKVFVLPWPKLVTISRWNDQPVFEVSGLEGLTWRPLLADLAAAVKLGMKHVKPQIQMAP